MRSKARTVRRRLIGAAVMLTMALGAAPGDGGSSWQPHSSGWVSGPLEHFNLVPVDGGGAVGATLR